MNYQNHKLIDMAKGFSHLHMTVVVIFLLLFATKVVLLLLSKNETLTTLRNKTKVIEMILGTLILITGGYLLFSAPVKETWMWVKLGAVLALIPMGIVGLKKENKALAALSLAGFIYFFGVSETKSLTFKRDKIKIVTPEAAAPAVNADTTVAIANEILDQNASAGKAIYEQVCKACHGPNGDLAVGGAANLTISKLTKEERVAFINKGKGLMPAYKDALSESEIDAVAEYIAALKK